jgi:hypothetical protein
MMSRTIQVALVVGSLCAIATVAAYKLTPLVEGQAEAKGATMTKNDVSVSWSLRLVSGGSRLHLDYTVANKSNERILVWDLVVTTENNKLVSRPDAISTIVGDSPDTALFVRGHVFPNSRVNVEYVPGVRAVDAGKSLQGSAEVPLPLQAWLAYGQVQPFTQVPTKAVFELQFFHGSHATSPMPVDDGTLPKPAQPWGEAIAIRSDAQPIPTK